MAERFLVCHTGDAPPERVRAQISALGVEFVALGEGDLGARLAELRPSGYLVNEPVWDPPYLSAEAIDAAGCLELVTYAGATPEPKDYEAFFDLEALRARRIAVTTTMGATISVAEGTISLLGALNLDVVSANVARKRGHANVEVRQSLFGSLLGIVGMGQIGSRVARLAAALGMRVLYNSRRRHFDMEDEVGATFWGLQELFERSDHVTVHSNYSLTRGLIGRDALVRARSINLVNTAHPPIVAPDALLEALEHGWVRRTAIEGRYPEPYDERFRRLGDDRVLLLPFMSWSTTHCNERTWDAYAETVTAFREGRQVPYRIA